VQQAPAIWEETALPSRSCLSPIASLQPRHAVRLRMRRDCVLEGSKVVQDLKLNEVFNLDVVFQIKYELSGRLPRISSSVSRGVPARRLAGLSARPLASLLACTPARGAQLRRRGRLLLACRPPFRSTPTSPSLSIPSPTRPWRRQGTRRSPPRSMPC